MTDTGRPRKQVNSNNYKSQAVTSLERTSRTTGQECWKALLKMRAQCPLVQCITNYVSMDIMANSLLSIGASPAMVHAEEEVEEFVALVSALSINIGTLSKPWISSMHKAAAKANVLGKPWVLDPVGAGATNLRTQTCKDLVLHEPTVIRGNASEIMALANCISIGLNALPDGQRGVDSTESADIALTHAKVLAKECNCVVVVTGKDDHVTDGSRVITVSNGHPILQKITACGCSLTSVIAAFVSVVDWTSKEQVMKSCAHALCVFGIAGELAAEKSIVQGVVCPGSARVHLMDALSYMNCEHVQQMAKFP